jgi:hypothetical protein
MIKKSWSALCVGVFCALSCFAARAQTLPTDAPMVVEVKAYGAIGDGDNHKITQADIDANKAKWLGTYEVGDEWDYVGIQEAIYAAFGAPGKEHGSGNSTLNRPLHISRGNYKVNKTLLLRHVLGGTVYGDGRFATILSSTTGSTVMETNGASMCKFEAFRLNARWEEKHILFNLDWDGKGDGWAGALQSNTFRDMHFEGAGYGVTIGRSGFMGSENLFLNCYWMNNTVAGLWSGNFNALQNTVIGGNFGNCHENAIRIREGSVHVFSTGFQSGLKEQTGSDFRFDGSANDHSTIIGCRTESKNFVRAGNGHHVEIYNCNQTTIEGNPGVFAAGDNIDIRGCSSMEGVVEIQGVQESPSSVRDSTFGRADWLKGGWVYAKNPFLAIENNVVRPGGGINGGKLPDATQPFQQSTSVLQRNVALGPNMYYLSESANRDGGVSGALFRGAPTVLPHDVQDKNVPTYGTLVDMVSPQSGMPFGMVHMGSQRGQYIFGQQRLYFPISNILGTGNNGTFISLLNVMVDKVAIVVQKGGTGSISIGDNAETTTVDGATKYFHRQTLDKPGYYEAPTRGVIYDARSTTGSGKAGDNKLTVANPYVFNVPKGEQNAIASTSIEGAGADDSALVTRVMARDDNILTLSKPLAKDVTDAKIDFVRHELANPEYGTQWALWIEWNDIKNVDGYVVVDVSPFLPQ